MIIGGTTGPMFIFFLMTILNKFDTAYFFHTGNQSNFPLIAFAATFIACPVFGFIGFLISSERIQALIPGVTITFDKDPDKLSSNEKTDIAIDQWKSKH